jgi:hypothetical protein
MPRTLSALGSCGRAWRPTMPRPRPAGPAPPAAPRARTGPAARRTDHTDNITSPPREFLLSLVCQCPHFGLSFGRCHHPRRPVQRSTSCTPHQAWGVTGLRQMTSANAVCGTKSKRRVGICDPPAHPRHVARGEAGHLHVACHECAHGPHVVHHQPHEQQLVAQVDLSQWAEPGA